MKRHFFKNQKGSVVVMAIILTAGVLIAAVEFSVYTVNSVRQARNIDRSILAYYAAESGAESALHQLRKRPVNKDSAGLIILNPSTGTLSPDGTTTNVATWNLDRPQFSDSSDMFRMVRLGKNQSIAIPLYGNQGVDPLSIHSMKVTWDNESNCNDGTTPWIQAKTATWKTGGTLLDWGDPSSKIQNIKQYLKPPSVVEGVSSKTVIFNDVTSDPTTSEIFPQPGSELPMAVQVTSLYCDLYGVNVTFYGAANAVGAITPMSNIYTIAPFGDYQGVRQQLRLTLPNQEGTGISSLFNYVLFSEKAVEKN